MVAGMLPVALGWGGDSDFRSPMAIAVIGGLVTSTLLTLVIVPAVFTVFDDLERWLAPKAGRLLAEPIGSTVGREPFSRLPGGPIALGPSSVAMLPDDSITPDK
jgi:AcrB/AcrD/AcrF family